MFVTSYVGYCAYFGTYEKRIPIVILIKKHLDESVGFTFQRSQVVVTPCKLVNRVAKKEKEEKKKKKKKKEKRFGTMGIMKFKKKILICAQLLLHHCS